MVISTKAYILHREGQIFLRVCNVVKVEHNAKANLQPRGVSDYVHLVMLAQHRFRDMYLDWVLIIVPVHTNIDLADTKDHLSVGSWYNQKLGIAIPVLFCGPTSLLDLASDTIRVPSLTRFRRRFQCSRLS